MEDLIQNAHNLFDEHPLPSESVPSPNVAETTSTVTYDWLLLSPELSQQPEVEDIGSTTRHAPGGILVPTQSSFSSSSMESRFTPPTTLLSPLQGFPTSITPTRVEMTAYEQDMPDERGTKAVEILANSIPVEVMSSADICR